MYIIFYQSDASIKQVTIHIKLTNISYGYNFELGIPFAGYRVNGGSTFPSWVGIIKSESGYSIYVFSFSTVNRKSGACENPYIYNDVMATIFYI